MTCGIYKITNLINNKVYIGQSSCYEKRKNTHKNKLKRGTHDNVYLQRSYDYHGKDSFSIELIEECEREILTIRENYWMNFYESFNYKKGYNQLRPSENNLSYSHSDKSRKLLSEAKTLYTDEELTELLVCFHKEYNKIPTQRDLINNDNYPNYGTYCLRFGSFKNALLKSGLYDLILDKKNFNREKISENDKIKIVQIVKEFVEENGRFMECKDINKDERLPHSDTVTRVFGGSLENLMNECGYSKVYFNKLEEERILTSLNKLYLQDGMITKNTIEACPYTRSYSVYVKRFGKLSRAYELAGIPVNQYGRPISIDKVVLEMA